MSILASQSILDQPSADHLAFSDAYLSAIAELADPSATGWPWQSPNAGLYRLGDDDCPAEDPYDGPAPLDGAWELGFSLGNDCSPARPPADYTDAERFAFDLGYTAGRESALAEMADAFAEMEAERGLDEAEMAEMGSQVGHHADEMGGAL